MFCRAFFTETLAEFGLGMLLNVLVQLLPVSRIIANPSAFDAHGKKSAEGFHFGNGMFQFEKRFFLFRLGSSAEVANLVAFLASSQSSYMTGQAINVTGGQLMEL